MDKDIIKESVEILNKNLPAIIKAVEEYNGTLREFKEVFITTMITPFFEEASYPKPELKGLNQEIFKLCEDLYSAKLWLLHLGILEKIDESNKKLEQENKEKENDAANKEK